MLMVSPGTAASMAAWMLSPLATVMMFPEEGTYVVSTKDCGRAGGAADASPPVRAYTNSAVAAVRWISKGIARARCGTGQPAWRTGEHRRLIEPLSDISQMK